MLVKMMFGKTKPDAETDKILKILDKDKDGKLSLTEFMEIQQKIGTMLKPAVQMQHQMQTHIMSSSWWDNQIRHRRKILGPSVDISEMYVRILSSNEQASAKKREAKSKSARDSSQGKGETLAPARVYSKHDRHSTVVTKLPKSKVIDIREEWGKEGNKWYRVGKGRWGEGKYIRVTSGEGRWIGGSNYEGSGPTAKNDTVKKKLGTKRSSEAKGKSKYAVQEGSAEDWREMTDKKSGKKYWHNKQTGKTTWKNPHS